MDARPVDLAKGWNRLLDQGRRRATRLGLHHSPFTRGRPRRSRRRTSPGATPCPASGPDSTAAASAAAPRSSSGERIYLLSEPHDLVCLRKADGKVLWVRTQRLSSTPPRRPTEASGLRRSGDDRPEAERAVNAALVRRPASTARQIEEEASSCENGISAKMAEIDGVRYKKYDTPDVGFSGFTPVTDGTSIYLWLAQRRDRLLRPGRQPALDPRGQPSGHRARLLVVAAAHRRKDHHLHARSARRRREDGGDGLADPAGDAPGIQSPGILPRHSPADRDRRRAGDRAGQRDDRPRLGRQDPVHPSRHGHPGDQFTGGRRRPAVPDDHPQHAGVHPHPPGLRRSASQDVDPRGLGGLAPPQVLHALAHGLARRPRRTGLPPQQLRRPERGGRRRGRNCVYQRMLDIDQFQTSNEGAARGVGISPTLAGKHLYLFGNNGGMVVLEPGRTFKQVAKNKIENIVSIGHWGERQERFVSNPVFDGDRLYIRGEGHLYAIAAGAASASKTTAGGPAKTPARTTPSTPIVARPAEPDLIPASQFGWRRNGTGHFPGTTPPHSLGREEEHPVAGGRRPRHVEPRPHGRPPPADLRAGSPPLSPADRRPRALEGRDRGRSPGRSPGKDPGAPRNEGAGAADARDGRQERLRVALQRAGRLVHARRSENLGSIRGTPDAQLRAERVPGPRRRNAARRGQAADGARIVDRKGTLEGRRRGSLRHPGGLFARRHGARGHLQGNGGPHLRRRGSRAEPSRRAWEATSRPPRWSRAASSTLPIAAAAP